VQCEVTERNERASEGGNCPTLVSGSINCVSCCAHCSMYSDLAFLRLDLIFESHAIMRSPDERCEGASEAVDCPTLVVSGLLASNAIYPGFPL